MVAQTVKNPPAMQEILRSLGREDPLEKGMATHCSQYSCLENSKDRGAWRATVHGGHKESDVTQGLTLSLSCLADCMY